MNIERESKAAKLWISYPWIHREERDFTYLNARLKLENFETVYDPVRIVPDEPLSGHIVQRLQSIDFDGWLYILTHQCVARREYTDELTAAIDQTKLHMGPQFPVVGLMYGIASDNIPPALRVLPCISLGDSNWHTRVREAYNKHSRVGFQHPKKSQTRFIWNIHPRFKGDASLTLLEVRTKGEIIQEWRFAVPKYCRLLRWGQGISKVGEMSKVRFGEVYGSGQYERSEVLWFGASNTVTSSESAYLLFSGRLPDFVCFGPAQNGSTMPGKMEIFWPGHIKHAM